MEKLLDAHKIVISLKGDGLTKLNKQKIWEEVAVLILELRMMN
jgi:hypothetical protein